MVILLILFVLIPEHPTLVGANPGLVGPGPPLGGAGGDCNCPQAQLPCPAPVAPCPSLFPPLGPPQPPCPPPISSCPPPPPPSLCLPCPPPPPPPLCLPSLPSLPPLSLPCPPQPSQLCSCPCKRKKRSTPVATITSENGTSGHVLCNNSHIRKIILKNLSSDAKVSKAAIYSELKAKQKNDYVVLCSQSNLSFTSDSMNYCVGGNTDHLCYVFQL